MKFRRGAVLDARLLNQSAICDNSPGSPSLQFGASALATFVPQSAPAAKSCLAPPGLQILQDCWSEDVRPMWRLACRTAHRCAKTAATMVLGRCAIVKRRASHAT